MTGSCFADNISKKMSAAKFDVTANPTGILFNPLSIHDMLAALAGGKVFTREDIQTDGNLWFSWAHHGSFSGTEAEAVLGRMNASAAQGAKALAEADTVIITFGTAWVYRLAETGMVVANCHKQPAGLFRRERLTAEEITAAFSQLLGGALRGKNVVFTVSPVRHLRDGFEGNSLSKAILRTAIGELVEKHENAHYFPSFEIMTDDLRDYRFYADDMLHPSPAAVGYIWEKFTGWCMAERTRGLLPRIDKLSQAMGHRTLQPGSASEAAFAARMREHIAALAAELPGVDFSAESEHFSSK